VTSDDDYEELEEQATDGVIIPGIGDLLGKYIKDLSWKLQEVEANSNPFDNTKPLYVGETRLKPGISDTFWSPMECFQRCGGCNTEFVALLAQHSNDYMKRVAAFAQLPEEEPTGPFMEGHYIGRDVLISWNYAQDLYRAVPNEDCQSRYFLVLVLRTCCYRVDQSKVVKRAPKTCVCLLRSVLVLVKVESYDSPYKSYVIMLHDCQT
jgi:hypothetical protein